MLVTPLELQPVLLSPCPVFICHPVPEKKVQSVRMAQTWASPPTPAQQPWPCCAPASPYLEQCSCHVEDDEDECECGMPSLHTADGVEEHQVSWNHEQEEDPGRARIHIWDRGREGVRRKPGPRRFLSQEVPCYTPGKQTCLCFSIPRSPAPRVSQKGELSCLGRALYRSWCSPAKKEDLCIQAPAAP